MYRHDTALADSPDKYAAFLAAVIARQAALVARWQCVGFVHGVLNTDNTLVSGETIDYGPCAFMDGYNPDTVFSSIDHHGRYRYAHQPAIIQWNLARLAEAMVPLLSDDEPTAIARANEALDAFAPLYRAAWLAGMRAKLGLVREEPEDLALAQALLAAMAAQRADFTNTFRALSSGETPAGLDAWAEQWNARLGRETRPRSEAFAAMRTVNPAVIPRNHRVEAALSAAEERGDLALFHELLAAVSRPFTLAANHAHLTEPPPSDFVECYRTFCGT
jgi:serine/tyrosine/threonine adenylyltransferase